MKGRIRNTHESSEIMSMRIFFVALKNSKGSNKVSLFEEVSNIWKLVFLLLKLIKYLDYLFLS